jgi:hypothetical protein
MPETQKGLDIVRTRHILRHALEVVAEGGLIALLAVSLIAGTALAAKGGGKPASGSSSLSVVLVVSADATISHGDTITFAVSTTATTRPFVSLVCRDGSTGLLQASAGFFPDYPWSTEFRLASSAWTSGGATCDARLYSTKDGTRTTTLATRSFAVAP